MKFLILSDLHNAVENLLKLQDEFKSCDAVLFAGDFAECFKPETSKGALEKLCLCHDTIFSVLGNCDNVNFLDELEARDISVEKSLVFYEGLVLCGSGGGTFFTGKTEFERSEEEILSDFDIIKNATKEKNKKDLWQKTILISHNPPKNTKCDAVNEELHAGSELFTQFIKKYQPLLVVTGHIHEGRSVDKIKNTTIINPGALQDGNYATLKIEKSEDSFKITEIELKTL